MLVTCMQKGCYQGAAVLLNVLHSLHLLTPDCVPTPGRKAPGMRSVLMQLRKCCNHAFLLDGVEEEHAIQVCSHPMPLSYC